MVRNAVKALMADVILLASLFYVILDLQSRAAFAASPHNVCGHLCSYTPSFSYNLLTQFFTMTGNGQQLVSPPTLDWVQLLSLALVVVNVWLAYAFFAKRREAKARRQSTAP
jgi:hypothetical protein